MATPIELARRHHRAGNALRARTERAAMTLWRRLDRANLDRSWRTLGPRMLALMTVAQTQAARGSDDYTAAVLEAQGVDPDADGAVVPAAFARSASDGRGMASLLAVPVVTVKELIGRGMSVPRAMSGGLTEMLLIVGTQVADAGRAADGVALAARPRVGGYVRMLSLPSCPRCAILAGRFYRWSAGFLRHPRCDCRHIPANEDAASDLRTDPRAAFNAGEIRGLTRAETKAIQDGAEMARVVNVKRSGITVAGDRRTTTEATGRRVRLTPEQIYADATSRDDAIRLLRRFGYIR